MPKTKLVIKAQAQAPSQPSDDQEIKMSVHRYCELLEKENAAQKEELKSNARKGKSLNPKKKIEKPKSVKQIANEERFSEAVQMARAMYNKEKANGKTWKECMTQVHAERKKQKEQIRLESNESEVDRVKNL